MTCGQYATRDTARHLGTLLSLGTGSILHLSREVRCPFSSLTGTVTVSALPSRNYLRTRHLRPTYTTTPLLLPVTSTVLPRTSVPSRTTGLWKPGVLCRRRGTVFGREEVRSNFEGLYTVEGFWKFVRSRDRPVSDTGWEMCPKETGRTNLKRT